MGLFAGRALVAFNDDGMRPSLSPALLCICIKRGFFIDLLVVNDP